MLQIFGRRSSFNVQKVLWFTEELGLDYGQKDLGGRFGGLDDPDYLEMNPHGKVPLLKDDALTIWESQAILNYLAAKYGAADFWPESPAARSHMDRWVSWGLTTLQPNFMNVFWGFYRTPDEERNWPFIKRNLKALENDYQLLGQQIGKSGMIIGNDLSLADILIGASLYRYFEMDIKRPSLPNVEAYYKRLQARPAYAEHVMFSFEELKGRMTF